MRKGSAVTMVAYGTMAYVCEAAAKALGVDAEIIDVRTMVPLDVELWGGLRVTVPEGSATATFPVKLGTVFPYASWPATWTACWRRTASKCRR